MQPLSPVDAISPAFSRARTILLPPGLAPGLNAPFRFWFFLKIAITAALTESNIYGAVFGILSEAIAMIVAIAASTFHRSYSPFAAAGGISPAVVTVIAIAVLFFLFLAFVLAWLWCRLRFTLFDLIVYRHGLVSRAWSPYGPQAWRFFGLTILIGVALLLFLAVTAGPLVLHLILVIRHLTPQQINADPFLLMSHIFPLYGIIFLFALIAGLINAVAQDFILPPMALEDAPLGSAFARFFQLLRARFWYVALFLVLAVLGAGGAGIGFVLYRVFWHAGSGGIAIFVIYCILAGLIVITAYLLMILALYGSIAVVRQSYAAYFYGSYYPQLGDRLEPPPPIPAQNPPFAPPPNPSPTPIQSPPATA
jgi:hypothetical protein